MANEPGKELMRKVIVKVKVPTNQVPLQEDVDMTNEGFEVDKVVDGVMVQVKELYDQTIQRYEDYIIEQNNMSINNFITKYNDEMETDYTTISELVNNMISTTINNNFVTYIQQNVNIGSVNVNIRKIMNRLNIIDMKLAGIKDLDIKMSGRLKRDNDGQIEEVEDRMCSKKRITNNLLTDTEPSHRDPSSSGGSSNEPLLMVRSVRMRGIDRGDVSEPSRVLFYTDEVIDIRDLNETYHEDYFGMFDVQQINEIPMIDNVNLTITQNNPNLVWDIVNDYINTSYNNDDYNPIGIRRVTLNVDVQLNNEQTNYFEKLGEFAYANYNNCLIKHSANVEDIPENYVGNIGVTKYNSSEKIYINNHKYTIEEENEQEDSEFTGFNSVIQTSVVPIMDRIVLPAITDNGTFTYSISQFNSQYSLNANSSNPYRDDFIGMDTIEIPINVNKKLVPLLAQINNQIYTPQLIDPDAIGFSSVQVTVPVSGGNSSNVNNLIGYTFNSNTQYPYTIAQYNASQNPPTSYTGFDSISVNVSGGGTNVNNLSSYTFNQNTDGAYTIAQYNASQNPPTNYTGFGSIVVNVPNSSNLDDLSIDVNRFGNYNLQYRPTSIALIPIMDSNSNNVVELTAEYVYLDNFNIWKMFDGDSNTYYTLYDSDMVDKWILVHFLSNVVYDRIYFLGNYQCDTSISVYGSNDNIIFTSIESSFHVGFSEEVNIDVNNLEYQYIKLIMSGNGEIATCQFYKSNSGFRNVDVHVNTNFGLNDSIIDINKVENSSKKYFAYDLDNGIVSEELTNNVGTDLQIINVNNANSSHQPWILFDGKGSETYYELNNHHLKESYKLTTKNF